MRYILDDNGYVELCSKTHIECNDRGCTEYTGTIPSGYDSIEEWSINANIRAYKMVDGNLVYDANRDAELQRQYEKEKEDNTLVTKKYVDSQLSGINVSGTKNLKELFDANSTDDFEVIQLTDTSDFEINKLVIKAHTSYDEVNIVFNALNILPNELLSTSKSGLSFNVLVDKNIEISGTTSEAIEIDLAGTNTSIIPILTFKKGVNYYLSGLEETKLNMYYYDGTNRTQVYSGFGGSILFDKNTQVTEITLSFDKGTSIDKTIKPMLNLGDSALDYEKYDVLKLNIDIPTYEFLAFSEDLFLSENLYATHWGDIQIIIEDGIITIIDDFEHLLGEIAMPSTFYPTTTIYTLQDTTMSLDYITSYSNGVPYEEVIKAINDSPETITINADRINISGVITAINNDTSTTIDGNKITTGTITAEQVAADIITTKNFSAQTINADNITAGTLRGRAIEGGTITGSTISGGSINIAKGVYYFNMGTSTSNPNCSGLNVGGYGVNFEGRSGISGASNISVYGTGTSGAGYYTGIDTPQGVNIRDGNGGVWHLAFVRGILVACSHSS